MHRQTSIYSIRGKRVRRASHQGEPVPVEVTRTKVQKVKHIWRKLRTSYTYRLRIAYSVGLLWAYMMLGWTSGQLGPVLLDLVVITQVNLELASMYIIVLGLGYIVGSFGGGVLYNRVNRPLLLCVTCIMWAVFELCIPWSRSYGVLIFLYLVDGMLEGVVDTVANTEIVCIWNFSVESWMQAMYFMLAVGAVIAPLATFPFLAFGDVPEHDIGFVNPDDLQLYKAYIINATLIFIVGVLFLYLYIRHSKDIHSLERDEEELHSTPTLRKRTKTIILLLMGGMCFMYTAIEETFSEYLTTFCVYHMGMTKMDGSGITSLFYFCFGVSRFIGIFLVRRVNAIRLVGIHTFLLCIVLLCLSLSGYHQSKAGLWVFSAFLGIALSIIYPILYTWTDEHFIRITGKISAWFVIAASIGGMINPPILGHLIQSVSAMWFPYIILLEALCLFVFYDLALILQNYLESGSPFKKRSNPDDVKIENIRDTEQVLNRPSTRGLKVNTDKQNVSSFFEGPFAFAGKKTIFFSQTGNVDTNISTIKIKETSSTEVKDVFEEVSLTPMTKETASTDVFNDIKIVADDTQFRFEAISSSENSSKGTDQTDVPQETDNYKHVEVNVTSVDEWPNEFDDKTEHELPESRISEVNSYLDEAMVTETTKDTGFDSSTAIGQPADDSPVNMPIVKGNESQESDIESMRLHPDTNDGKLTINSSIEKAKSDSELMTDRSPKHSTLRSKESEKGHFTFMRKSKTLNTNTSPKAMRKNSIDPATDIMNNRAGKRTKSESMWKSDLGHSDPDNLISLYNLEATSEFDQTFTNEPQMSALEVDSDKYATIKKGGSMPNLKAHPVNIPIPKVTPKYKF